MASLNFSPSSPLPPPPQNNNSFTNQEACCEVLLWAHDFFRLTAERLVRGKQQTQCLHFLLWNIRLQIDFEVLCDRPTVRHLETHTAVLTMNLLQLFASRFWLILFEAYLVHSDVNTLAQFGVCLIEILQLTHSKVSIDLQQKQKVGDNFVNVDSVFYFQNLPTTTRVAST